MPVTLFKIPPPKIINSENKIAVYNKSFFSLDFIINKTII